MRSAYLLLVPAALLLAGCGDDEVVEPAPGGEGPPAECTEPLCLAPPEKGFQVRSTGTTIEPGQDIEYCEIVQLPGTADDVYWVNRLESEMTVGSHHLIVAAIEPGSPTEQNAKPGDQIPCFTAEAYGEDLGPVTGSQVPYHEDKFPPGVGRRYTGGQLLVFDYHYFNTTSGTLPARAAVNFHTVEETEVQKVAKNFGFYNFTIDTPPGQEASFDFGCDFSRDVMVHKVVRHTHRWGTDFSVWHSGGERDGELVFTSNYYEDTDHVFEEPVLVKKGDGFRFQCNYKNTESYSLTFGVKATDEMCILFGTWWEAGDEQAPDQDCAKF